MDALILGLAMVVLVGAGVVFRRVPRKGSVRGAVAFVAGLRVAALGVKALSHHLHLYPDTD